MIRAPTALATFSQTSTGRSTQPISMLARLISSPSKIATLSTKSSVNASLGRSIIPAIVSKSSALTFFKSSFLIPLATILGIIDLQILNSFSFIISQLEKYFFKKLIKITNKSKQNKQIFNYIYKFFQI